MSIDKFLKELDEQDQEFKNQEKITEELRKAKEKENEDFLNGFNSFYNKSMIKDFKAIKEKLKDRFEVNYDSATKLMQFNIYGGNLTISPKFKSPIKTVTITTIGEAGRRLVTFAGTAIDNKREQVQRNFNGFQDTFDKFIELNIESEVTEILEAYFLKNDTVQKRM